MSDQIAAGELRKGHVAVDGRALAEPIAYEHEGMLPADHRSAYDQATQRGESQQMDDRLTLGTYARSRYPLAQLMARERTFPGQGTLDRFHGPLGVRGRYALLAQP